MQDRHPLSRPAAVVAGLFSLVLFAACAGQVKVSVPTAPNPTPQPGNPPQPQPQPPTPRKYPEPVVRLKAYELFDMAQEGEDKYKGKVVAVSGLVDVDNTRRPGPGGTSTLVVKGRPGETPYATATFGHDSEELLFAGTFKPPSVTVQGIYRGRDEHGTVQLDDAKVTSLTNHFPVFDFRRDDPRRPSKPPRETKKDPITVSAQQLAQDLQDDLPKAYRRYYGPPLRIDGVVARQSQSGGAVTMIQFEPAVTDRKSNKRTDFTVFCGLRNRAAAGSPEAARLAVGQRVTVVGKMSAAGNGQATLTDCVVESGGR